MKCGYCREIGHTARICRKKPDTVNVVQLDHDIVSVIDERVSPIIRAEAKWSENIVKAVARSCYLQGLLDARTPEVEVALDEQRKKGE